MFSRGAKEVDTKDQYRWLGIMLVEMNENKLFAITWLREIRQGGRHGCSYTGWYFTTVRVGDDGIKHGYQEGCIERSLGLSSDTLRVDQISPETNISD